VSVNLLFNSFHNLKQKEELRSPEEEFAEAVSLLIEKRDILNGIPKYIAARKKLDYDFLLENNPIHVLISGLIYEVCEQEEKAHYYYHQILENYEANDGSSGNIAFLNAFVRFQLAKVYVQHTSSIEKSIHLKKAEELYTQIKDSKGLANCYCLKGNYNFVKGNYIGAIENFGYAMKLFMEGNHNDDIIDCYMKIADCNVEISNYRESERYLQLAMDKAEFSQDSRKKSELLFVRAKSFYKQNNIQEALDTLDNISKISISKNNITNFSKYYALMAECYGKLDRPIEQLQYEKTGIELKFNIAQIEKELVFENNNALHLFEKHESEILLQEKNNIEINDLKSKLQISKEENDRLVVLLSHDFKEPIRVINSFASLLEKNIEGTHSEKDKEYIQYILRSATRMSGHIDNLLKYIQLDTDSCQVAELDLNDILNEVKNELSGNIEDKKAIVVSSNLPKVKACKDVFNVLFFNLVENAIKFNRNTPIVKIDYTKRNNTHEFSVSDNGIGIADDDKDKVFDLFRKLHKTNEFEGWGVGLSVSKKIVNSMGGQMKIEDNPNGGTKVKFVLSDSRILN
jgi:signal transduction histidine kinase